MYSTCEVSRLCGVKVSRLRRWHRTGLLRVPKDRGRLQYGFRDIAAARAAAGLMEQGVTSREVAVAVESIRAWRPDLTHPVGILRINQVSGRLVFELDGYAVEPTSGQLVLDLADDEQSNVPENLVAIDFGQGMGDPAETADSCITKGLAAEEDDDSESAERWYRRALSMEPRHAGALVNLGNLVFEQGRHRTASELYRAATRVKPSFAPAWYNLANSLDELGRRDLAVENYKKCLSIDPNYADAHFNLALVLEKDGSRVSARHHWEAYLNLEPEGPSANIARAFLDHQEQK